MSPGRGRAAALAALAVVAVVGCGFGGGPSSEGEATLTVTRDYGAELLLEATAEDPQASDTVIRMLDREAEITTRYGGGFVQSIEGVSGGVEAGRSLDWFFYVNGIESPNGAADVPLRAGDRIWWDHRDWTEAMRVPAVVGSWPEPFAQASAGPEREPVQVACAAPRALCTEARERLAEAGAEASLEPVRGGRNGAKAPGDALRLVVGEWEAVRDDPVARLLARGPASSGVFARFAGARPRLLPLDSSARPVARLGAGAGLVAALRDGERPPSWLVTGTDRAGVEAAVVLLDAEALRNRYALAATPGGEPLALPAAEAR